MTPKINLLEGYLEGRTTTKEGKRLHASLRRWRFGQGANRPPTKEQSRASAARLRAETIAAYGGQCAACSEDDPACLTVDHLHDNGAAERRTKGLASGSQFYSWLRRFAFPKDDYQLLCWNCQWRKRAYGPDFSLWPQAQRA